MSARKPVAGWKRRSGDSWSLDLPRGHVFATIYGLWWPRERNEFPYPQVPEPTLEAAQLAAEDWAAEQHRATARALCLPDPRHEALFAAGLRGGPGAWRWASDPEGTTLDTEAAWERMLGEMRERSRPLECGALRPSVAVEPTAHVPVESAEADGARLVLSEAEMATELRAAGWTERPLGWMLGAHACGYMPLAEAHAAMRAAKGAK